MHITGIIPARYASTRFPGKPLVDINGLSMIQRVYLQAKKCDLLTEVIVATDDTRILNHVLQFGGKGIMTSPLHTSGTERCCEAMHLLPYTTEAIINIQGDEPFIEPAQISLLAGLMARDEVVIGTLIQQIKDISDLTNPNVVKVVTDCAGRAMYFSRSPVPYLRNPQAVSVSYYRHVGIYGYRCSTLEAITKLPPTPVELAESLEQLRWLQHGYVINTALTHHDSIAVDTPEDLSRIMAMK